MNGSQALISSLAERGVDSCASVPGGGIMYLVDAVGQDERVKVRFCHHEQSAAFAAEAYARATSKAAMCLVTIGPGVANAVAGALSAFLNSVPCIFVSGAKRSNIETDYARVRFNYPQDADTRSLVSGVVKEFFEVKASSNLAAIAARAIEVAHSGRPGPVWISFPLDLQGAPAAIHTRDENPVHNSRGAETIDFARVSDFLARVKRPILLVGRGAEPVKRQAAFQQFLQSAGMPVITSIGSNHTIAAAGPANLGFFGPTGRRAANWALTKADAIIALGSGLDIDNTGFDRRSFFLDKAVMAINSDPAFDLTDSCSDVTVICTDLRNVDFGSLASTFKAYSEKMDSWMSACLALEAKLSIESEVIRNLTNSGADPYLFCQNLVEALPDNVAIAGGISLDVHALSHVAKLKLGQEFFLSPHCGQLGWDLPAAIGLLDTELYSKVVCVTGDGSAMFNLQELATMGRTQTPFSIFVIANDGYNSIRTSQDVHLKGRYFGSDSKDLAFPDWGAIAKAFGLVFHEIASNDDATPTRLAMILGGENSVTVVNVDPKRGRTPRLISKIQNGTFVSPTLAEQFPFLSRDEVTEIEALFERL